MYSYLLSWGFLIQQCFYALKLIYFLPADGAYFCKLIQILLSWNILWNQNVQRVTKYSFVFYLLLVYLLRKKKKKNLVNIF